MTWAKKFAIALGLSVQCMMGGVVAPVCAQDAFPGIGTAGADDALPDAAFAGGAEAGVQEAPQVEAEPTAEEMETYREAITGALKEFRVGNWPESIRLFELAHEANPNARTLRGLGLAHFENRSYVKAAEYLTAALDHPKRPLTKPQRREAKRVLKRAMRYVARFKVRVTPEDADVFVDGFPATFDDGMLLLDPGLRYVSFQKDGYYIYNRSIEVDSGPGGVLHVDLTPRPDPKPVAEIPEPIEVPDPVDGGEAYAGYEGPPGVKPVPWQAWALGGTGAALLSVAVVTGLQASSIHSELKKDCSATCPSDADDRASSGNTYKTLTNVFLVGGLVSLGAGATWWLLSTQDEASDVPLATFGCTMDGCMAAVSSEF